MCWVQAMFIINQASGHYYQCLTVSCRLLVTEKAGKACRDDSVEGLKFYPNLFLETSVEWNFVNEIIPPEEIDENFD
jgi:hypothetical protein